MACEHIKRAQDKIKDILERINNIDDCLYEKMDPYLRWNEVKQHIETMHEKIGNSVGYGEDFNMAAFLHLWDFRENIEKVKPRVTKKIKGEDLYNCLREIFNSLNDCNCYSNVSSTESSLSFYREHSSNLEDRNNKLERELKDLRDEKREKEDKLEREIRELKKKLEKEQKERKSEKEKYDNEELAWTRTEGEKNTEIARLEEKSRNDDAQKTRLEKRAEDAEKDRDNQVGRLELKLDQKSEVIRGLNNQLSNLRVSDERKDNEIRQKNEEMERLKRWAGLSREELLSERMSLKYGKLEIFANQIGINLQQVDSLCRYCERLVHAQKNYNQANVETHEINIARVREGLRQNGVQIEDIQKFCRKCEKVAQMRFELNEIRRQQSQYEARQETLPHNNRIN